MCEMDSDQIGIRDDVVVEEQKDGRAREEGTGVARDGLALACLLAPPQRRERAQLLPGGEHSLRVVRRPVQDHDHLEWSRRVLRGQRG